MHSKPLPSQGTLKELFDYNPETGELINRVDRRKSKTGTPAGCINSGGYVIVCVDYHRYRKNRIVWMWMTGEDPLGNVVDHIDGDRSNDKWCNLRLATISLNNVNSKTRCDNLCGFKGVYFRKDTNKFSARICKDGKVTRLGCYDTAESAAQAYDKAALELFGDYALLNF
jgi:hypothetical protein